MLATIQNDLGHKFWYLHTCAYCVLGICHPTLCKDMVCLLLVLSLPLHPLAKMLVRIFSCVLVSHTCFKVHYLKELDMPDHYVILYLALLEQRFNMFKVKGVNMWVLCLTSVVYQLSISSSQVLHCTNYSESGCILQKLGQC